MLGDQGAQLADLDRRHPDPGQQPGGVELRKGEGSFLIGLDLGAHDQGYVRRVGQGDRVDIWHELVMQLEGVRAHLHDQRIVLGQVFLHPALQPGKLDGVRAEDLLLLGVDANRHQVVLVDIETDETRRGCGSHFSLLSRSWQDLARKAGRI